MHPKVAAFWDNAFPNDGRRHRLVLGEYHDISEHTKWLKDHLSEMQARGVNSIGYEQSACMNVFLWAYADGTLTRELGSQQAAKDYIKNIWVNSTCNQDVKLAIPDVADMLTAAIDRGMHVVCYDTRDSFTSLSHDAEYLSNDVGHITEKARVNPAIGILWQVRELKRLVENNPDYRQKIGAIDSMQAVGYRLIDQERITSDGLSACMLQALMPGKGNSITIAGFSHNTGIMSGDTGSPKKGKFYVDGIFPHHLQAVAEHSAGNAYVNENAPQSHRITTAVLTSTKHRARYQELAFEHDEVGIPCAIPVVTLEDGTASTLISYSEKDVDRLLPDDKAFEAHFHPCSSKKEALLQDRNNAKRFVNPMLIPELKKACEVVHALMHGEKPRGR